ncbi:hypothetical protein L596_009683 [Steinernema carpocapsae]|uniref:Uncharacterized protein n=1 Tax=Steinernema carpocapsae TaxID=34508 RepID=A0A4U5PGK4_STECR|nr:hypothetical protein L596_009683 [Steinernema carpocapsae]
MANASADKWPTRIEAWRPPTTRPQGRPATRWTDDFAKKLNSELAEKRTSRSPLFMVHESANHSERATFAAKCLQLRIFAIRLTIMFATPRTADFRAFSVEFWVFAAFRDAATRFANLDTHLGRGACLEIHGSVYNWIRGESRTSS